MFLNTPNLKASLACTINTKKYVTAYFEVADGGVAIVKGEGK